MGYALIDYLCWGCVDQDYNYLLRIAIVRARRKEREEASRGGGGTKAGGLAASPVGDGRCL